PQTDCAMYRPPAPVLLPRTGRHRANAPNEGCAVHPLRAMHRPEASEGGAATPPMEVLRVAALSFDQYRRDEAGQTMAEYAVVLGVVSLVVIAALTLLSTNVANGITRF